MRRPASSSRPSGTSAAPRRRSALAAAWSEVVRPAIAIALVGACAVFYLVACARLSVIECDLRRLEHLAQDEQGRELDLHRQFAELGNAERVRAHIIERGLCRPAAVAHVTLTDVPEALDLALPTAGSDQRMRDMRLGQLPPGQPPAGAVGSLYASASSPQ